MEFSIGELRELLKDFMEFADPDSYYRYETVNRFLIKEGFINIECQHKNREPAFTAGGKTVESGFYCHDCREFFREKVES